MDKRLTDKEKIISEGINATVFFLDETSSTNAYAREIIKYSDGSIESPVIVTALKQTAGRGRLDRKFESNEGGVYLSYCEKLTDVKKNVTSYPIVSSLAALKTVKKFLDTSGSDKQAQIKWPNDILVDGKKVCGILTEMVLTVDSYWIIFGIGLNVNNSLSEQLFNADSLSSITGEGINTDLVIRHLILNLKSLFAEMPDNAGQLISDVQINCLTIGKTIKCESSGIEGVATAIRMDGALEVQKFDGTTEQIVYGDVTITGKE